MLDVRRHEPLPNGGGPVRRWTRRGNRWTCLHCRREEFREAGDTEAAVEFELQHDPTMPEKALAAATGAGSETIRCVRARLNGGEGSTPGARPQGRRRPLRRSQRPRGAREGRQRWR